MKRYQQPGRYIGVLLGLAGSVAQAGHLHERPDAHAPIGVMGDHVMGDGELMLTYRDMNMFMDGNLNGTEKVAVPLAGYMVSPLSMDMKMQMLGLMYGLNQRLTLSVMMPMVSYSMTHRVNATNVEFTTESSGLGDISIAAIYQLKQTADSSLLFNFSVSGPSGSIDEKDVTPASGGVAVQLPYPMQPGKGSHGVTPGLTYSREFRDWSWGTQLLYTRYIENNANGYRPGNRLDANIWLARKFNHSISVSLRLNGRDWKNITGADSKLSPIPTVPTKDPDLRAGKRLDMLLGVNFVAHSMNAIRFAFEVGTPVYQNLAGPQLETDLIIVLGTQYAF